MELSSALSEYERERMRTIETNKQKMRDLGLDSGAVLKPPAAAKRSTPKSRPAKRAEPAPPTRASKRTRGHKPDYTGANIDRFGEELDRIAERRKRHSTSAASPLYEEDADVAAAKAEAARSRVEKAELVRKEALERMARLSSESPAAADDEWRAQAITMWGDKVAACEADDWEAYVVSRTATPAPQSPFGLIQERFAVEPWKMLCVCILIMRCSSENIKETCIRRFFEAFATPSALLEAHPSDVEAIIKPLGLFHESRWPSLVGLSERWLQLPRFEMATKGEFKVPGCGPFCVDSFHLFCKDDWSSEPTDKALLQFWRWRKTQPAAAIDDVESKFVD